MQLDRYVYAAANPINTSDPTGQTLTEYGALAQAVSINTQNVMQEVGKAWQQLFGVIGANLLSVQAKAFEEDAQQIYESKYGARFAPQRQVEAGEVTEEGWNSIALPLPREVGASSITVATNAVLLKRVELELRAAGRTESAA